ncbi:Domain first found in C1r, C1s, uEGF, and bone morphoproteintic protein [Sparganum proliferum]
MEATTCGANEAEVLIETPHSGHFHHPGWPSSYGADVRCLYRFIAPPGRKVLIEFTWFHIAGLSSYCQRDFLDVYIDVASTRPRNMEDAAYMAYLKTQDQQTTTPFSALLYYSVLSRSRLLGRYCGRDLLSVPVRLVSIHREIILDFLSGPSSDLDEVSASLLLGETLGFNGTYKFIPDDLFYPGKVRVQQDLPPLPKSAQLDASTTEASSPICQFVIQPEVKDVGVGSSGTSGQGGSAGRLEGEFRGEFVSPAYPGLHPPGLVCVYQFVGRPNQRVRVEIRDLSLQSQFDSCPTDYVQFYDGADFKTAVTIGDRFCGEVRDLQVVSTDSTLLMLFTTGAPSSNQTSQVAGAHNAAGDAGVPVYRGFHIVYTFSDRLVSLDQELKEKHIRGTECDFFVRSEGESEGFLESPHFLSSLVIAPNHSCAFYFLGLHQPQKMESVRISFDILDLPSQGRGNLRCNKGHLAIYGARMINDDNFQLRPLEGNQTSFDFGDWWDPGWMSALTASPNGVPASQIWCAHEDNLSVLRSGRQIELTPVVSWRTVLILRLNATGAASPGMTARFRAFYKFTSDYAIPGTMIQPGKCWFQYKSSDLRGGQLGWTNSPFFANTYPANAECVYIFTPAAGETVALAFTTFQTTEEPSMYEGRRYGEHTRPCHKDYLEVFEILDERLLGNVMLPNLLTSSNLAVDTEGLAFDEQMYHIAAPSSLSSASYQDVQFVRQFTTAYLFCGSRVPGPIVPARASSPLALVFRSDAEGTGLGFQLNFRFIPRHRLSPASHSMPADCGGNISSLDRGGIVHSPGYPHFYAKDLICEWFITAQPHSQGILLHFTKLSVEGSFKDCRNAVVRIYEGSDMRPSLSICGTDSAVAAYISDAPFLRMRMLTTEQAVGAEGFEMSWTEILPLTAEKDCPGFLCRETKYCISNKMECNGIANCGTFVKDGSIITDDSDERVNCPEATNYSFVHIGIGVIVTIFLLATLVIIVLIRERRRKRKLAKDPLAEGSPSSNHLPKQKHQLVYAADGLVKPFLCTSRESFRGLSGGGGGGTPGVPNTDRVCHHRTSLTSSVVLLPDGDLRHAKSYADMSSQQPQFAEHHHQQHSHSNFHRCQNSHSQAHLLKFQHNGGTPKVSHCRHQQHHQRDANGGRAAPRTPCRHSSIRGGTNRSHASMRTLDTSPSQDSQTSFGVGAATCPRGHLHARGADTSDSSGRPATHLIHMHPIVHRGGLLRSGQPATQLRPVGPGGASAAGGLSQAVTPEEGPFSRERMQKISIV